MIRWREAFERCKDSAEFKRYFSKGKVPLASDFRYLAYCQQFNNVAAGTVVGGATPNSAVTGGVQSGPTLQNFPAGAIVLGITAAAQQAQTTTSAFQYAPWQSPGKRDLFALSFQYTNDEIITPGGPVLAEALLGSGEDTIFPSREIIVPPSQGLLATVVSYAIAPPLNVHIVYHAMVPKVAN
jgi:hypothetical protein